MEEACCDCRETLEKLVEKVEHNTQLLEEHILDKGRIPDTLEEDVAELVRENGKITKQEIKTEFDVSEYQALKLMRNLKKEDIRYIPGQGSTRSKLYYTNGPITKKAVKLIKALDQHRMIPRQKVEELLEVKGKKIHKIVKMAKEFSGNKITWNNKKLVKLS